MKKILLLLAVAGAAVFLVQRRRQAAAAEAALWDEATGKPSSAGGYPGRLGRSVACRFGSRLRVAGSLGDVAQLAEHRLCKAGVESSILFVSTRWPLFRLPASAVEVQIPPPSLLVDARAGTPGLKIG